VAGVLFDTVRYIFFGGSMVMTALCFAFWYQYWQAAANR